MPAKQATNALKLLEFFALIILRIREPGLRRPFMIPGGVWGTVLVTVGPFALIVVSVVRTAEESVATMNGLVFCGAVTALGLILYRLRSEPTGANRLRRP